MGWNEWPNRMTDEIQEQIESDTCGKNSLNFNYLKYADQIFIAFST